MRFPLAPIHGKDHVGADNGARGASGTGTRVCYLDGTVALDVEPVPRQLEDVCRTDGHAEATPLAAILVDDHHPFCHQSFTSKV